MLPVCVVLCTYNGERYLGEQLASIAAQTRLPQRVIIVDDRSTDRTPELAREFAAGAGFPVLVRVNEENLGYQRNFERAIGLADDGEVIVLADQDDVWHPSRLARVEAAFARSPQAGLVFSDAEVVDAELAPLGYRLWEAVGFSRSKQALAAEGRMFEVLVRGNVVTGATMAFPARFRSLVLPVDGGVGHDAWIALLLAAVAPVVAIPEPLVRYRQHGQNQIGARRLGALDRLRRARQARVDGLERRRIQHVCALGRLQEVRAPAERLALLREAIAHLEVRAGLSERRVERVGQVLREMAIGRYRRTSEGLPAAFRDLLA